MADKPAINSGMIRNASGIIGLELFGTKGAGTQLSGVLLHDQAATTLYFPHVAGDDTWWTGIAVYNPSSSDTSLTITSYNSMGTSLGVLTKAVAGKSKYIGTAASLGLPSGTQWFRMDSTSPVTGFELFGTTNANQLAGYTSVHLQSTSGVFAKIEKSGWTGIAFVNTETSESTITLTAFGNNGSQVTVETFQLDGYSKRVDLPENMFSADIGEASYIQYASTHQIVGFQLNGSADGMMLDALPGL